MDYIKLHIQNIDKTRLLERLDFMREINTDTGEFKAVRVATYHYCTIKIYDSGRVQFAGSVHKMWNSLNGIKAPKNGDKGFNGNDLTTTDIYGIRDYLTELFDCQPSQMIFENIEIGVNLVLPFAVSLFLKGLLFQQSKQFEPQRRATYWQCVHSNYLLKAYDKGKQYGMTGNVMRFEIKVTRMSKLNKVNRKSKLKPVNIKSYADVNTSTLGIAFEHLTDHFEQIVHYDRTIDKKSLTRLQKIAIRDYSNVTYWLDMISKERDRPKKKLAFITKHYSQNIKAQIRSLIIQKCVTINQLSDNPKCVTNNTSSIPLIITQPAPKICPITGADISMQKDDSGLLSNTGIKEIEKTNPALFERLKRILLTGNPNKFETDVYSKISKQIRNRFYNNPSAFNTTQISLF